MSTQRQQLCTYCVLGYGNGNLQESDVLVLPLDMTDVEAHAAATDTVIKHFGQVTLILLIIFLLSFLLCSNLQLNVDFS